MEHTTNPLPGVPNFAELLSQLPVFVSLFDKDRRITWSSRWGFGCDDALLGTRPEEHIHPDDRDTWIHGFRCAIEGQTVSGECRCHMPDGGPVTRWGYRMGPHRIGGEVVGVVSVCWDVTLTSPLASILRHPRAGDGGRGGDVSSTGGCSTSHGGAGAPGGNVHLDGAGAFLFTPTSTAVVELLRAHGPLKGNAVGKRLGMLDGSGLNACSKLRFILSSLEERKVLRNSRDGYELTPEFATLWLHLHTTQKTVQH